MIHASELFVDTSGWGCYYDVRQPQHKNALLLYRSAILEGRRLVTTNYILVELVALLASPLHVPRPAMIAFIETLRTSPYIEIVHVDSVLDRQAWELLTQRQDKEWSLVDCVSFVIMRQRGITDVLTTDHHFEQAGFVRLLKP